MSQVLIPAQHRVKQPSWGPKCVFFYFYYNKVYGVYFFCRIFFLLLFFSFFFFLFSLRAPIIKKGSEWTWAYFEGFGKIKKTFSAQNATIGTTIFYPRCTQLLSTIGTRHSILEAKENNMYKLLTIVTHFFSIGSFFFN